MSESEHINSLKEIFKKLDQDTLADILSANNCDIDAAISWILETKLGTDSVELQPTQKECLDVPNAARFVSSDLDELSSLKFDSTATFKPDYSLKIENGRDEYGGIQYLCPSDEKKSPNSFSSKFFETNESEKDKKSSQDNMNLNQCLALSNEINQHTPMITLQDWEQEIYKCMEGGTQDVFPMYRYQITGVKLIFETFFSSCSTELRRVALLADEMGLGKTRVSLAASILLHRSQRLRADPCFSRAVSPGQISSGIILIVCPKSTVHVTWKEQLKQYTCFGNYFLDYTGANREENLKKALDRAGYNVFSLLDGDFNLMEERMLFIATTAETLARECTSVKKVKAKEAEVILSRVEKQRYTYAVDGIEPIIQDSLLLQLPLTAVILDEITKGKKGPAEYNVSKNKNSNTPGKRRSLQKPSQHFRLFKQICKSNLVIALSGTPITNRMNDIANTMHFLGAPPHLHDTEWWLQASADEIRKTIKKYIIRRTIQSVGLMNILPQKTVEDILVPPPLCPFFEVAYEGCVSKLVKTARLMGHVRHAALQGHAASVRRLNFLTDLYHSLTSCLRMLAAAPLAWEVTQLQEAFSECLRNITDYVLRSKDRKLFNPNRQKHALIIAQARKTLPRKLTDDEGDKFEDFPEVVEVEENENVDEQPHSDSDEDTGWASEGDFVVPDEDGKLYGYGAELMSNRKRKKEAGKKSVSGEGNDEIDAFDEQGLDEIAILLVHSTQRAKEALSATLKAEAQDFLNILIPEGDMIEISRDIAKAQEIEASGGTGKDGVPFWIFHIESTINRLRKLKEKINSHQEKLLSNVLIERFENDFKVQSVLNFIQAQHPVQHGPIIITSCFLRPLFLIKGFLNREHPMLRSAMLHGGLAASERENIVNSLMNGSLHILFLSQGCGKEGITLTASNRMLVLDVNQLHSQLSQVTARIHRLGQKREVFVTRLATEHTVEEYYLSDMLPSKQEASSSVTEAYVLDENGEEYIPPVVSEKMGRTGTISSFTSAAKGIELYWRKRRSGNGMESFPKQEDSAKLPLSSNLNTEAKQELPVIDLAGLNPVKCQNQSDTESREQPAILQSKDPLIGQTQSSLVSCQNQSDCAKSSKPTAKLLSKDALAGQNQCDCTKSSELPAVQLISLTDSNPLQNNSNNSSEPPAKLKSKDAVTDLTETNSVKSSNPSDSAKSRELPSTLQSKVPVIDLTDSDV